MRIMIDTNVLVSAALFADSRIAKMVMAISDEHEIALCSQVVDELHIVFARKFADKLIQLERFLSQVSWGQAPWVRW